MNGWAEELLGKLSHSGSDAEIFRVVEATARDLGFDYCAYGLRAPWPLSKPKTRLLNNYPEVWQKRYQEARYLEIDPTVRLARRSQSPMLWSDVLFVDVPEFWAEAQAAGLRFGWAQSAFDSGGIGGMLTLARTARLAPPSLRRTRSRCAGLSARRMLRSSVR